MGIISRTLALSGFLAPRSGARPADLPAAIMLGAGLAGMPQYPEDDYYNYAREGYGRNEIVYACIREIYTSAAEGRLRAEKKNGAEIEAGALADQLRNPNPEQEQFEFLENINLFLDIAGKAPILKERGAAGQIVAWRVLRPDRVTVVPGPRGPMGYIYTVAGVEYPIAPEDMGVVKLMNPFDDFEGLSPLHVLAKMVNLDGSMTDFNKSFFANSAIPGGILNVKRRIRSKEEADELRSHFMSMFSGRTNWFRLPVLDEDASYQQIASSLKDMDLPGLRDIPESRICAGFGVPPIVVGAKIGLDRSTFANYKEAVSSFWDETIMPRNKLIRGALRRMLAPDYEELQQAGVTLDWDYSDVKALAEGEDERSTRVLAQWEKGLITRDEARDALGYDPAPPGYGAVFAVPIALSEEGPDAEAREPEPAPITLPTEAGATDEPPPATLTAALAVNGKVALPL